MATNFYDLASGVLIPSGYAPGTLFGFVPYNDYTKDANIPADAMDFAWARNSNAVRTNKSGLLETMGDTVPRIDHSDDVECGSVLAEQARENITLWSEEFDNSYWGKSGVSLSLDSGISPDGLQTMDLITEDDQPGNHGVTRSVNTVTIGAQYVISLFLKYNGRQWMQLSTTWGDIGDLNCYFDVLNGVIGTQTCAGAGIEDYGNGIYRCWVSDTVLNVDNIYSRFYMRDTNGGGTYQGDGVSGQYIWGAMIEEGSYPTSYIKTEATTANRGKDAPSSRGDLQTTGLFTPDTGSLYLEFGDMPSDGFTQSGQDIYTLYEGVNQWDSSITLMTSGTNYAWRFFEGTTIIDTIIIGALSNKKTLVTWNATTAKLFVNGIKTADFAYVPSAYSKLRWVSGNSLVSGGWKQKMYFNHALTDEQGIELTS